MKNRWKMRATFLEGRFERAKNKFFKIENFLKISNTEEGTGTGKSVVPYLNS